MSNSNMNWDPNLYTGQPAPEPRANSDSQAEAASGHASPEAQPEQPQASAWPPPKPELPSGRREQVFAIVLLAVSLFLVNTTLWGGSLGFTLGFWAMALVTVCYLSGKALRVTPYGILCLLSSFALAGAFSRSADWSLLVPAFLVVLFGYFMGLVSLTRANARPFGGFSTILDIFHAAFCRSFGQVGAAFRGLFHTWKGKEKIRKPGSAFWGVLIAVPVLCVLVPLLMKADAAFEGLISQFQFTIPRSSELWGTVILGLIVFLLAYPQAVSLKRSPSRSAAAPYQGRVPPAAVNAFLGAIALVYCLYLLSQLAYFFNAFQGILPEGFSHAAYARRGFFEMAWIVAINLAIVGIVLTLEKRETATPKATKFLCLFFCAFSLLLIATAFSKMVLYMNSYGLTRKRVLTSLFMLWLTVFVATTAVWLFRRKLPYMKVAVVALLLLANLACWADADSVIARYNVTAYQSGKLDSVDLYTLSTLSDSAIPWVAELTDDEDPAVAERAQSILRDCAERYAAEHQCIKTDSGDTVDLYEFSPLDWRCWNFAAAHAREVVIDYLEETGCLVDIANQ